MRNMKAELWKSRATAYAFYPLPHHALSRLVLWLTRIRLAAWKNALIERFCRHFGVDLSEAVHQQPADYEHFNAFFTRQLQDGCRPLPSERSAVISPCDGYLSQRGRIQRGRIHQAKGHSYTTEALVGDAATAQLFEGGEFATLYLAPPNYHRVHMPLAGRLQSMTHVPGRLFSVASSTVEHIPGLFARNERVVTRFETALGPVAVIFVGALCVGSIETVWHGAVTPPHRRSLRRFHYGEDGPHFERGHEIGRFNMGSTVIVLLPAGAVDWTSAHEPGDALRMGTSLGTARTGLA